jgi:hypothetical protein
MFVTLIGQMFCDIVQHLVGCYKMLYYVTEHLTNKCYKHTYYSLLQDAVLCHRTSDQLMLQTYLLLTPCYNLVNMFVTFIGQMFCDIVQHLVAGSSKYVCNIYWSDVL